MDTTIFRNAGRGVLTEAEMAPGSCLPMLVGGALVLAGLLGKALADRIAVAKRVEAEVDAVGKRFRILVDDCVPGGSGRGDGA